MFFVFSVAALITVVIAILLGIYLVSFMLNPNLVRFYPSVIRQPPNVISLSVAYPRCVIGVCIPRVINVGSELRVSVGIGLREGVIICCVGRGVGLDA